MIVIVNKSPMIILDYGDFNSILEESVHQEKKNEITMSGVSVGLYDLAI